MKFAEIESAIRGADRRLLREVSLLTSTQKVKNLPEGKKSYAVKMKLQDMEKRLTTSRSTPRWIKSSMPSEISARSSR